ncbi:DUF1854 domain-containing protein [Aquabacterium lacunae]|uniref:DUF1854 domain-containing protein n=1 Tax=Aquabacterium lacunae TaxID=2528630 RepID=A0A4V2JFR5_9BURK|nr:DUF1854 domain-containing protein [Aquabacterium lacunae]TBO30370.1 DUF1854 domain-containing protein [Aquabacterium lacunae]
MTFQNLSLQRDAHGLLVYTDAQGQRHEGVVPVRAFPLSAPDEGVSLVGSDGHELLWIDRLSQVPAAMAELIREELASRDFVPVIRALLDVSTFATPSTWTVETDRGPTSFILKSEDDIRRLPGSALLINSSHGVVWSIPDRMGMDKHSRKLLERFL